MCVQFTKLFCSYPTKPKCFLWGKRPSGLINQLFLNENFNFHSKLRPNSKKARELSLKNVDPRDAIFIAERVINSGFTSMFQLWLYRSLLHFSDYFLFFMIVIMTIIWITAVHYSSVFMVRWTSSLRIYDFYLIIVPHVHLSF